jgi:hypothetical protein
MKAISSLFSFLFFFGELLCLVRYSGYCAWRGVLDGSTECNAAAMVRRVYPDLGRCLYFDIAQGTHSVLYELPGGRLNWLWYINQPEPHLKVCN